VLIEADPHSGDVALLCGIEERYTLADVIAAGRLGIKQPYADREASVWVVGQRGCTQRKSSGRGRAVARKLDRSRTYPPTWW